MNLRGKIKTGVMMFAAINTISIANADPTNAHQMDVSNEKTVMCRGPVSLHHESSEDYNLIVIESALPFAAAGSKGQLLKPGQCGNLSKGTDKKRFIRWSPKSFEQIMHRSEQSFQFALNCLMSDKYVYVFKEQYLTGRSHCIPWSAPVKRARN